MSGEFSAPLRSSQQIKDWQAERPKLLAAADPELAAFLLQALRAAFRKHDFTDSDLYWFYDEPPSDTAQLVLAEVAIALKAFR